MTTFIRQLQRHKIQVQVGIQHISTFMVNEVTTREKICLY